METSCPQPRPLRLQAPQGLCCKKDRPLSVSLELLLFLHKLFDCDRIERRSGFPDGVVPIGLVFFNSQRFAKGRFAISCENIEQGVVPEVPSVKCIVRSEPVVSEGDYLFSVSVMVLGSIFRCPKNSVSPESIPPKPSSMAYCSKACIASSMS